MAGASLLALIDDISMILDDVSVMTKIAAKKTAGVLGDDVALNANQVSGVQADRELPVVWKVAVGSFVNKLILVPLALLISAVSATLVTALLMLGGLYLCFEGAEKVFHHFVAHEADKIQRLQANADEQIDLLETEKQKIKGAIRTDFILSAEIIVIALGTMTSASLLQKSLSLSLIAIGMTVGVYGLVAGIVKLDDLGMYLTQKSAKFYQKLGQGILYTAPVLMKLLSIVGTVAMFLVGGGIMVHGIGFLEHGIDDLAKISGVFSGLVTNLANGLVGLVAGFMMVGLLAVFKKVKAS